MKINKKILIILCSILILSLGSFGYLKLSKKKQPINDINEKQMRAICELATLKTYYHNTAKFDHDNKFLFFFNTKEQLWIEYSGIVEISTDISKLSMEVNNNSVVITIPHSKITNIKIDETSLTPDSYHVNYKGLFNDKIDFEIQQNTFKEAQEEMEKDAYKNAMLFIQADERAENLLGNYVKNVGMALGKEYTIEFKYIEEE